MPESDKRKVLIVDEHPDNRRITRFMLRDTEAEIIEATSVKEALGVLETISGISLIITELPLGHNMWAGLDIIEATRGYPGVTVLVYTTHIMQNAEQRARDAGATEFIPKPSPNFGQVRAAITRLLESGTANLH